MKIEEVDFATAAEEERFLHYGGGDFLPMNSTNTDIHRHIATITSWDATDAYAESLNIGHDTVESATAAQMHEWALAGALRFLHVLGATDATGVINGQGESSTYWAWGNGKCWRVWLAR